MSGKVLALLVLAALVTGGQSITEIRLEDENRNHISNPMIGFGISIPKWWFDSLVACSVIFPNGMMFEVFPNNNIPEPTISASDAVEPFNSCGIGFRHPPNSLSGTYELLSHVKHSDETETLTRQRFHITITQSEVEFPFNAEAPVNPKFKYEIA